MENIVIQKEIKNKIILASNEIFVFRTPYVIPIPNESILEEMARPKNCINIKRHLFILYGIKKIKLLKRKNHNLKMSTYTLV